jgi:IS5 family transposase
VEGYRDRYGCYPERALVDKIYRNRETIAWCREREIQITGPALRRPPKDKEITKQAKKQEYQVICDRNIVEGEFGVGKRAYGLNRIMAHLPETSVCVIGVALICLNLAKRLRSLCFALSSFWFAELLSLLPIRVLA